MEEGSARPVESGLEAVGQEVTAELFNDWNNAESAASPEAALHASDFTA